jgi:uncharacterized membrane protein
MNSKNTAFQETRTILLGQILCTAAMIAVFAVLGYYQRSVLLGGIAGAAIATANYFFMSFFANRAADKAEAQDVAGGQKLIQLSYMGRMLGMFLALIVLAKSGFCHPLSLVLPLAFTRPILTIAEIFNKKGENKL